MGFHLMACQILPQALRPDSLQHVAKRVAPTKSPGAGGYSFGHLRTRPPGLFAALASL